MLKRFHCYLGGSILLLLPPILASSNKGTFITVNIIIMIFLKQDHALAINLILTCTAHFSQTQARTCGSLDRQLSANLDLAIGFQLLCLYRPGVGLPRTVGASFLVRRNRSLVAE